MRSKIQGGAVLILTLLAVHLPAAGLQQMHEQLPRAAANLAPLNRLPGTQRLHLALGLPLRNQSGLSNLLHQLYDPASPNYHQFLTPQQFADQFGPTPEDYAAVEAFARSNGFAVSTRHPNRVLLDVEGSVADIEKALHVHLNSYRHPTESRNFYAPDTEPSLDLSVPLAGISGLDNFSLPQPRLVAKPLTQNSSVTPNAGSGVGGTYMGHDFRTAYVPGSALTGAGQSVGLLQFDGYTAGDITYYETLAGLPNVPLVNVLLDGFDGQPSPFGGQLEVSLDIEASISMAPGLSSVILYMAGPFGNFHDILNRMATDDLAKQLSCSWFLRNGPADPVADGIFQQMAAQGQSFMAAAGDSGAYSGLIPFPDDNPYITMVGGTILTTTGPGGAWASETTWPPTGGGISTQYPIPSWQSPVSMTLNNGSTVMRNIPDVALTSQNVYVRSGGQDWNVGGTSCASPLWAGFISLINQQALQNGQSVMGFLNPAVYKLGLGSGYGPAFHDITTGNNSPNGNPAHFPAVPGFDLCTGWGTPVGQPLIDALAPPDTLLISPNSGFVSAGAAGGPFSVTSQTFALTNTSGAPLTWSVGDPATWLSPSSGGGVLPTGGVTNLVVSLDAASSNLPPGLYTASLAVTNVSHTNFVHLLPFSLLVHDPLVISPTNGFNAVGPVGGPFNIAALNLTLTNTGLTPLNWALSNNASWLDVSSSSGTLGVGGLGSVTVSLDPTAYTLPPGLYSAGLVFSNLTGGFTQSIPFSLQTGLVPLQNGGFELGNFVGWNVSGNTVGMLVTSNTAYVHSGVYGAELGSEASPGSLTQTLATSPGQVYLISFWAENRGVAAVNDLQVDWNGVTVFDEANVGPFAWTNIQVLVGATGTNGVLQFTERNDNGNFGLDDVQVFQSPVVGTPPVITAQPTNETLTAGWTATFTTAATGIQPVYYQWQLGGSNLPGATSPMLVVSPVTVGESGNYSVVVSNAFGATNSSVAVLAVNVPVCDPPAPGLVSWWQAEGNAADSFGTNNGTLQNGAGFAPGEAGQAFSFNGVNQFVQVPDSTSWDFNSGDFSIELWAEFAANNGSSALVAHDTGNGAVNKWIFWLNNGLLQLHLNNTSDISLDLGSGAFNPVLNAWYHLAVTRSGPVFSFYVDGSLVSTVTNSTAVPNASAPLTIGEAENLAYLDGQEDEVSIYSRALGAAEIQAVYNAGSAGKCATAPVITGQPQGQTLFAGSTATLAVIAQGSQPLSYQWSVGQSNLPLATNATLVLTNAQPAQSGNYSVLVSNAEGSTNSAGAVLTVLPVGTCDPAPSGLVSWWQAEDNAADSSGTNNGTLQNGAGFAPGEAGQAFSFNGVNQYVQVPDSTSWDFNSGDFSIELWANFAASSGSRTLVAHDTGGGAFNKWVFWLNNGQLQFHMNNPANISLNLGSGAFNPTSNTWYHLAVTRSGSLFSFYVNGALLSTATSSTAVPVASAPLTIGETENLAFFDGQEDEVSIYSRALAAAEIQLIYNAGSGGKCPPLTPPTITLQPTNQTVPQGQTAAFNVGAIGAFPLAYQWQFNQSNILASANPTATNATLILTNLQPADAGNYSVIITNSLGTTNSSNALLTVTPPVLCDPPPTNLLAWWQAEGNAADSSSTNNGTLQNGAGFISGEAGQAFNFNGVNQFVQVPDSTNWDFTGDFSIELWANFAASSGSRALVAHDTGGGAFNKWVFWLNNGQLQFHMNNPGNINLNLGSGAFSPVLDTWYHLAVTRTGTIFTFYVNGVRISSAISSAAVPAASAPLTIGETENLAFFDGQEDEVSIYNRALGAAEIQAVYNAGSAGKCAPAPVITSQPQSQPALEGVTVTFAVAAVGGQPLGYQWSVNQSNLPLATNATLVLTNVQPAQSGNTYTVLVSNPEGSTNSANAVLTVLPPGTCDPPPSGLVSWWAAEGNAADSFSTNNGALENGASFAPGEVGQAFNFNGVNQFVQVPDSANWDFTGDFSIELWANFAASSGSRALVAHDTGGGAFNKWVFWLNNGFLQFHMNNPANIGLNLGSGAFNPTLNTWYHLAVTRSGPVFSFYVDGALISTATNATAVPAASAPLTIGETENLAFFDGQEDEVSIYNRALSATDIRVIYNAGSGGKCQPNMPPRITAQPAGQTVPQGQTATFSVGAAGTQPLAYQWQFNQGNIPASANPTATNATLILTNVQPASAGNYSVTVANFFGSTNSSNALLTVLLPPTITRQPNNQLAQVGCTVTFSAAATGSGTLTYQWQENGTNLPGQNSTNLALLGAQLPNFGNYTMIASNAYGSATSRVAVLALDHLPVPGGIAVQRFPGAGVRMNASDIVTKATDADGDILSLISVASTSVEGGTIILTGPSLYYTPPAGLTNADAFTYTISDGHCDGTATGTILVNVRTDLNPASRASIFNMGDGSVDIFFDGEPGVSYRVQSTTTLAPTNWQDVTNLTADQYGTYIYVDWPATNGPVRYFRSVTP